MKTQLDFRSRLGWDNIKVLQSHFFFLQGWRSSKVITYVPGGKGSGGGVEVVTLKETWRLLVAIKQSHQTLLQSGNPLETTETPA